MELSNMHKDALKEIINIASGNAATSLSGILKKKIDMNVPVVEVRKFSDVSERLCSCDDVVMATLLKVLGDVTGNVLLVVKEKNAKDIAYVLLKDIVDTYDDDMVISVFQEIGNIVGNAYLVAMGKFLDLNLLSSVPYISIDNLLPIMSSAYIAANETDDYIIDIECTLYEDNIEFDLNIFFILPMNSVKNLTDKIDCIREF